MFGFRDSVEATGLAVKKNLGENKEKIIITTNSSRRLSFSPKRSNIILEPTWFTPPRSDCRLSKTPSHVVYESGIESDDNVQNSQEGDDIWFYQD